MFVLSKIPSPGQIAVAVDWLRCNEGEGYESESCRIVADWIDATGRERSLRLLARENGIPYGRLKRKLEADAPDAAYDLGLLTGRHK